MSEEVDFICGCPVEGCTNTDDMIRWTCSKCGSYEKINEEGIVRCLKSNCLKCPLVCLNFKCAAHNDRRKFDPFSAFKVVGQISNLDLSEAGREFKRNLRKAIDRQLDEHGL